MNAPSSDLTRSGGITLWDIRMFLRRRWTVIVPVFFAVLGLAALVTFLTPKKYEARMKLLVKNDRAELLVSPGDGGSAAGHPAQVTEIDMNSEIELLRSADILRNVVMLCKLDRRTPGTVQAAGEPSASAVQSAVRGLQKNLTVTAVKKSNVIDVAYLAPTPEQAKEVLNQLVESYLAQHLKLHGTPGSRVFFEVQAASYEQRLREAEAQLTRLEEQYDAEMLPDEKRLLLERAMVVQSGLEDADAAAHQYAMKIADAHRQLAASKPRILTQVRTSPYQSSVDRLHTLLVDLQNRRTELRTKFRGDDRLVTQLDKEIADTQASLDQLSKLTSTEQVSDVNPLREALERDLATSELELSAMHARHDTLGQQLSAYHNRMTVLQNVTAEHDALDRRRKEYEENYLLYVKKQEEARIADSLDQEKIANVAVAEHPTGSDTPARPRVLMNLALGVLLAAFISVGVALGLEYLEAGEAQRLGHPATAAAGY